MFTLYVLHFLYATHNIFFIGGRFETLVVASLCCLFKKQYSLFVHEEVQKLLFFLGEEWAILVFKFVHPSNLFVVVFYGVIGSRTVNNQAHTIFDVLECFETSM